MNEYQKRSVSLTMVDLHRRMAEMEAALDQSLIATAFNEFVNDLTPTERQVLKDYFNRVRSVMSQCLKEAGIALEVRKTSVRWSIQCGMMFLNMSASDLGPRKLQGYGALDENDQIKVQEYQRELTQLIDRISAYITQGVGQDLQQRLDRLESSSINTNLLKTLERIISRWGLVEFQGQLDLIVRRLESPAFEIAIFGRVSSGKSSLLNYIVDQAILPVGVTPITAVPTRIMSGDHPQAYVEFAELPSRTIPIAELSDFASEEGNPGNQKHVTNITVQMPSPRLRNGIIFVDTPGVGSLAKSGSAETYAYLPRCDLGVLLVDMSSSLIPDDIDLIRLLYEAGIPVKVLLSKADLAGKEDRLRNENYVREQIKKQLNLDLVIHSVSTVGSDASLLSQWFDQEIEPMITEHRKHMEASLRRKIGVLRESVIGVLTTLSSGSDRAALRTHGASTYQQVQQMFREADAALTEAHDQVREWGQNMDGLNQLVLEEIANTTVSNVGSDSSVISTLGRIYAERGRMAYQYLKTLQKTLSRILSELHKAFPFSDGEVDTLNNLSFRGLPGHDLTALRSKLNFARPWWLSILPFLRKWITRKTIDHYLGAVLREQLQLYERQLRAWLKSCVAQVEELYLSQAEIYKEQWRRLNGNSADSELPSINEVDAIRADLHLLKEMTSDVA